MRYELKSKDQGGFTMEQVPEPGSYVSLKPKDLYDPGHCWLLARCISPSWSESRLIGGEHYGVRLSGVKVLGVAYFFVVKLPDSLLNEENFFEAKDTWQIRDDAGFEFIGEFSGSRFELVRTLADLHRFILIMKTRREYISGEYRKHDSPKG